jgi:hypothetical protein
MVRRYLRELADLVEVTQGGDGQPASYYFTAALPAEFGSGLKRDLFRAEVPGWFRAEISDGLSQAPQNTEVREKKFRAEIPLSSSVENLKRTSGFDFDDEKSARVTVPPRATGVPFPEASKPSPLESGSQRQPHPDPELEMKLRLQERHPEISDDCLAFCRTSVRKFGLNWKEFLALDDQYTTNPAGLMNPIGYYYSLPLKQAKEAAAALRDRARVPVAVKETRCEKCRFGVLADGRFCDCPTGKDLTKAARWKQARATPSPAAERGAA